MAEPEGQSSTTIKGDDVQMEKKKYKQGETNPNKHKPTSQAGQPNTGIFDVLKGETFQGSGSLHGHNYQTKVMCLYFCQTSNLQNVRLATEVQAAGKLDDLVLSYEKEDEFCPRYCFLQAKEVGPKNKTYPKITPNDLMAMKKGIDPKFSLNLYFESYKQIREEFIREKRPLSAIDCLIMFTNADFDYQRYNVWKEEDGKWDKEKITLKKVHKQSNPLVPLNSCQFTYIPPDYSSKFFPDADSECLKEYLDKLVFVVNQPDHNGLKVSIMQVLNRKFNLVLSDDQADKIVGMMWNIHSQKVGKEVSSQCGSFFEDCRQELNKKYLTGIRFSSRNKIIFDGHFKDIELLAQFLAEDKSKLKMIASETPALSAIKVAQALQSVYRKLDYPELYFAVVDLESLMNDKERVQDAFKYKDQFVLAIKLADKDMLPEEFLEIWMPLLAENHTDVVGARNGLKKQIVFVCSDKIRANKLPEVPECSRFEDHCKFAVMTEKAQMQLMERVVTFQGHETTVEELIEKAEFETMKFNVDLCDHLFEDMNLKIGKQVEDLYSEEPFYVDRQFQLNLRFGKHLNSLPSTELLVFSKTDQAFLDAMNFKKTVVFKDKTSDNVSGCDAILLDASVDTTSFKKICNLCPSKNIHWFEKNGDSVDLVTSVQSIDLTEEDMMENSGKLKIITGEPGMGKSVVLTSIINKIKRDCLYWAIRINLLDVVDDLAKLKRKDGLDLESILDFLSKVDELEGSYGKELLRHTITKTDRAFLFFDGFDEIVPHHDDTVLKMIKILQETRAEIWLTTRSHCQAKLEDEFSVASYCLVAFSGSDQKLYLQRYWSKMLKKDINCSAIADFTAKLAKVCSKSHIQSFVQFSKIPLQTQMLSVIYQEDCKTFCASPKKDFEIRPAVDILDLYDMFVERKHELYFKAKAKINENNPNSKIIIEDLRQKLSEQHKMLAIKLLFQDDFKVLVGPKTSRIGDGDEQLLVNAGIVLKRNGKLVFIHRTFAEYFTAKYLAETIADEREYRPVINSSSFQEQYSLNPTTNQPTAMDSSAFQGLRSLNPTLTHFLRRQYFVQTNTLMRVFLDHQLASGSRILKATIKDDLAQMLEILKEDYGCITQSDILGRTPWLLAASYSRHWELPKYKQKIKEHTMPYYETFGGEMMSCIVEPLWKLKDNFDVACTDALGFNVICHAIGALDPNRKSVIFKASKLEMDKKEDMVLGTLDAAYLLDRDPLVMKGFLKDFLTKTMTAFWKGERCKDFLKGNAKDFEKMVTVLRLAPKASVADLYLEDFVNCALTTEDLFTKLLTVEGLDLSFLKTLKDIHKTKQFRNWLVGRFQSGDFASVDTIQKVLRLKIADLNIEDVDAMFKMAVETMNNKWVLALLPKIDGGWMSIDYLGYFKKLFSARRFKDFHMALSKSIRTEILGAVDCTTVFRRAIKNRDLDDLEHFFKVFNSSEDLKKMKANVEVRQVVKCFQSILRNTIAFKSEPLLSCISAEERQHVLDVLDQQNKSKLKKVIAKHQVFDIKSWEIPIDATELSEACGWLDRYPCWLPEDFRWSVWEHIYCLFCWMDSGIPLPPDVAPVLGEDYVMQVLDNMVDFSRVAHIFHLANDDQKRTICRVQEYKFLKHALLNYLDKITDAKCGDGRYLEKMQNNVLKLSEYHERFLEAAERFEFSALRKLTSILTSKKHLQDMWLKVKHVALFNKAFETMDVDFLIGLLKTFEDTSVDLLATLETTKIKVTSFSPDQVKKLDQFFGFLKREQHRSDVADQLDIVAEFRAAVISMDKIKLDDMFITVEHCGRLIRAMKEKVDAQKIMEYFTYFIKDKDSEGICALLRYISLQDDKIRRAPSFGMADIRKIHVMKSALATVPDAYLQQLIEDLIGYVQEPEYTVWNHVYTLFDGFWHFYNSVC